MCLCIFTSGKVQKSANIIIINEKLISAIYNNSSRLVECEELYIRSSHNKNRIFCLFLINHAFSFSLRAHIPFISLSPFLHEDPQHETYSSTYGYPYVSHFHICDIPCLNAQIRNLNISIFISKYNRNVPFQFHGAFRLIVRYNNCIIICHIFCG